MRPWCLMLWMTAWDESPISLPGDDVVIAAKIGMPADQFQQHRDVLLRGWTRCADGRLYHHVITELVNEMVSKRAKDRARTARYREGKDSPGEHDVTRDTRVTRAESRVSSPPTTHHPPENPKNQKQVRPAGPDFPPGFVAFWAAYPATRRRIDKGPCAAFWRREKLEPLADEIVGHVTAMTKTEAWREGYEPAPMKYLRGRRWQDGLPATKPRGPAI